MVKPISAYEASDGSLFAREHDAKLHDARLQLKKIINNNEGLVNLIIDKRMEIFDALAPMCIGIDLAEKPTRVATEK